LELKTPVKRSFKCAINSICLVKRPLPLMVVNLRRPTTKIKTIAYSGDGEHRFRFYREHLNSTHWVHDIFNLSVHDGQF